MISNILFNIVTKKLNLETSLLNNERVLLKNLKGRTTFLKKIRESNVKFLHPKSQLNVENNQNLMITYVINISFLKANTTVHVSDTEGTVKLFYSAGNVGLTGKQKRKRRIAVAQLISLLLRNSPFLKRKPVALHLNNVNFYKSFIVEKLKRNLYIRVIKNFNQVPYNGCRKRKVRRKKSTKKFK